MDPNNPPGPWSLPTPPRPTDLARLQKQFAEAQQQRQQRQQQYRAGVLQIRVDGVPIGEFDVQTASPLQFQVPCDACRVQIYGQDAVGPLLLAVFPMAGVAPATRGKTVTLQLTAARQADGTLTEELVELTYLPSQRVAAFALGACGFQQVHRFRSGLARRVIAARQAVESASVRLAWQARQGLFAWWKRFWAGSVPEADPEPEITDAATESPNVSESSMPVMARSEGGMPVKMGRGRAYRGNERLRHRKRRRSHFSPAIRALAAALRPAGSDPAKAWRRYAKIIATYYKKPPVRDYPYAKVKHAIAIRCRVNDLYTADLISTIMTQAQEEVQTLRPKPMIVLGDYGQGKTCFCGALAFQLAAAFRAHPSRGWLPIIVPLRHLSGLDTINESILRVLQESYGSVLSTADLDRARASSRLFALLDGLDEFMARSEEKDVRRVLRRISIAPLFEGNRLLITTRPNIIGENTHVTELAQTYDMLWIEPLTLEEARAYLKRQGLGTLLAQISGLTERVLSDLIRRPLFLEMMRVTRHTLRAVRSFQDLTEADLFDFYIRYWYDRERKAIGSRLGDLTYDEVDRILCSVAHALTHAGTDSISEEALEAHIASQVGSSSRLALNQLLSQGKERLILVPEFGGSERRFTFRHPSLQSYFTARYLSRQLSANPINPIPDPIEAITTARLDDVSLAFFIALAKKDQVVAARLEQWRQQLADTIHSPIDMRVAVLLLWELRSARGLHIECFRTFCERAPEEVRQFVLSNLKGADFSGMDLSGLRLTRANFRGARLVGTILTGANVGGAVFDEAEMQGAQLERVKADLASFTRAHLTGANLHEFTFRGNATGFAATTLTGATMTGAHFIGANFNDAALQSVDLRQAVFEESTFEGAQIVNALADDSEWRSCNVAGAEFFGTNTAHCVFHETDIEKALRDPE